MASNSSAARDASRLSEISVFHAIPSAELAQLERLFTARQYPKQTDMYHTAEQMRMVYVLLQGEVALSYRHYGKNLILETLLPGTLFGALDGQPEPDHTATATTAVEVLAIAWMDFLPILEKYPTVGAQLVPILASRLRASQEKMKSLIYDAKEKILQQLELLEQRKHRYERTPVFNLLVRNGARVTHGKLSHYTGLSRETVTRAIQDLRKEGKILIDPHEQITLNCSDCIPEAKAA